LAQSEEPERESQDQEQKEGPEEKERRRDFFSDRPVTLEQGLAFEFDALAKTMAALVRNPKNRAPFAIVVRGGWGRGKTTLLRQVERLLAEELAGSYQRRAIPIWFNAWKYPNDDTVLAGLLGALLDRMRQGSLLDQLKQQLLDRGDGVALGLMRYALPGLKLPRAERFSPAETRRAFYDSFRRLFGQAWYILQAGGVRGVARAISDLDHRKVEKALDDGQEKAVLAVFLDDLDRCAPERVGQVLEAINLFLDLPGVCFFLGLDWERVRAQLPSALNARDRELFLEKIVQVAFDLPEVNERGAESYVRELIQGSSLQPLLEQQSAPEQLDAADLAGLAGTELARREDWEPNAKEGEPRSGGDGVQAVAHLLRSRHPRHIKRMLNDLGIRLAVLEHADHLGAGPESVPPQAVLALHLLH